MAYPSSVRGREEACIRERMARLDEQHAAEDAVEAARLLKLKQARDAKAAAEERARLAAEQAAREKAERERREAEEAAAEAARQKALAEKRRLEILARMTAVAVAKAYAEAKAQRVVLQVSGCSNEHANGRYRHNGTGMGGITKYVKVYVEREADNSAGTIFRVPSTGAGAAATWVMHDGVAPCSTVVSDAEQPPSAGWSNGAQLQWVKSWNTVDVRWAGAPHEEKPWTR
jgi:hypothetical protein